MRVRNRRNDIRSRGVCGTMVNHSVKKSRSSRVHEPSLSLLSDLFPLLYTFALLNLSLSSVLSCPHAAPMRAGHALASFVRANRSYTAAERTHGLRPPRTSKSFQSPPKMTPSREESDVEQATKQWQEEPPFPVVPERNSEAQRMTLYALLVAAVVLPCVYGRPYRPYRFPCPRSRCRQRGRTQCAGRRKTRAQGVRSQSDAQRTHRRSARRAGRRRHPLRARRSISV